MMSKVRNPGLDSFTCLIIGSNPEETRRLRAVWLYACYCKIHPCVFVFICGY